MILLYHLVFPDTIPSDTWNAGLVLRFKDFKRQIHLLKRFYQVVSLEEYVGHIQRSGKPKAGLAALTFDDCYSQTYQVVSSFLVDEQVPATFFANTWHLDNDSLLWFVYFNALCFEKVYSELTIEGIRYPLTTQKDCRVAWQNLVNLARASQDARSFSLGISTIYPLPRAVVARYQGLSKEQMSQIGASSFFTLGGHTHSHPYLDQISPAEQLSEMTCNKCILEDITGKKVDHFAYTGGIYDIDSIKSVKMAGFKTGFATCPKKLTSDFLFEIPRTEIYGASLAKFLIKISGLADI